MSENFIRTLTEIHQQKHMNTIRNLIKEQIPCGFFLGFTIDPNIFEQVLKLKQAGLNIQVLCVIDETGREKINTDGMLLVTSKKLLRMEEKPQWMLVQDTSFDLYFTRLGIQTLMTPFMRNRDYDYEFAYAHLSNLFETYNLFKDEESKISYRQSIKGRMTGKLSDYHFAPEPQYWLQGFFPVKDDVVIDGGAYDAGTSVDFASQGAKVFAFEMDSLNYEKCLERISNYNYDITMENMGLSSEENYIAYADSGSSGSYRIRGDVAPAGGGVSHFIDIDTYVKRKKIDRIDYIKLDIEGSELDCLKGAAKSISRWKPKMAISAYHRPEDLWTLAEFVKSIRTDYEFAFRHYRIDFHDYIFNDEQRNILLDHGVDLFIPTDWEMVLYCK
ncbi:MAG: FkbM family methyltransferase [Selenomonadaceae bacterium]|nr:FkbM family methyltransferase [Selenomonadaceae bacterium]